MAFKTSVWFANGSDLQLQSRVVLNSERRLEDWIVADLSLLGEELLLIGRQLRTVAGPLDILAIDSEGCLVIAELKRDRTPREIVAQALDYASWICQQSPRDIDEYCMKLHGKSLADAFSEKFQCLLPEGACKAHRILVVAAELDDSSERIIRYLQDEHEIDINAVFFSAFKVAGQEMLVRAWLADPVETTERAKKRESAPWSGVWFVNNGIDDNPENTRDWKKCCEHGFISAGGDPRYSEPLYKLQPGNTIAAYQRKAGYVGVGTVISAAVPADDFRLADGKFLSQVNSKLHGKGGDNGEHVVGIRWKKTVPADQAKTFKGVFANQNVVCKLRDPATLEFLQQQFGLKM